MPNAVTADDANLKVLAAQIAAAYVGNHNLPPDQIPQVITAAYQALATLGTGTVEPPSATMPLKPAVPIRKSVMPDHIVCLEDGKKLTMLKRHLRSAYNMSPDQYRARWGLPRDYPMVAPNYAAQRSEHAKRIGLGRMRG